MRLRLVLVLATAILAALGSSPAQARAADRVIAHDTKIFRIFPLDGDLVYFRDLRPTPKRVWMARFHGHLRPARGIPSKRTVFHGDIGLDAKGRKVFTFGWGTGTRWATPCPRSGSSTTLPPTGPT